jgi:hypothetical protein
MSDTAMWNLLVMKQRFMHPMLVLEKISKNWCFVSWGGEKVVGSGHLSANITYWPQPFVRLILYAELFYSGLLTIAECWFWGISYFATSDWPCSSLLSRCLKELVNWCQAVFSRLASSSYWLPYFRCDWHVHGNGKTSPHWSASRQACATSLVPAFYIEMDIIWWHLV